MNYSEFLESKQHSYNRSDIDFQWSPDCAFDFQKYLIEYAVTTGRSAVFADCGLGKTLIQLSFAENVVRQKNKPVLIVTPLAVSHQTIEEANKFGIDAERSLDGCFSKKIVVTNYERLHYFNQGDFCGMVCDESSILKNFDGKTKDQITKFMRTMDYRLLCTATAAPNDYIELGTSSEALGELGYMDMLGKFFKNDQNSISPTSSKYNNAFEGAKWRFKKHAEIPFWRWVCSWARACRKPSDLGFSDDGYELPELRTSVEVVNTSRPMEGMLFAVPAKGLKEQREERAHTKQERSEAMADWLNSDSSQAVAWVHLNQEGDLVEKLTDDSIQVSGADSDEEKEAKFIAFAKGDAKVLVTKPKIGALGLNWQHCNRIAFFPSHSFEQYYQGVRRCWRFGQKKPVDVKIFTTEGAANVMDNLNRKAKACEQMFEMLVNEMNNILQIKKTNPFTESAGLPAWI